MGQAHETGTSDHLRCLLPRKALKMLKRQSRHLFVRIPAAQPESMGGSRADTLTLGPMGLKGSGSCLRGYITLTVSK